ncbi:MAG: 5'/3'-nucleotidase SurE [Firmicutes bacterium]|nr:5'/3'-nucleotidase SurE [Bacillota bacterium]MCL5038929.1 5'/3'-nucleotidase SurE [Bacillota bacterium]
MRLLLTNDDGIHAEGLQSLRQVLSASPMMEVFTVAPDRERSASGHAITMHRPLLVDEIKTNGRRERAWAVGGTPADCTKLAVEAILEERPDVVISGINRGPNLGTDVFYSGTVSAAIEGAMYGLPALAVSLTAFEGLDYTFAAHFVRHLLGYLPQLSLKPRILLNVNIPAVEPSQINGVRFTRLGVRQYRNVFDRRLDPRGRVYYWLAGELLDPDNDPDSDVIAIKNNFISITPIHLDLTSHQTLYDLQQVEIDLGEIVDRSGILHRTQ